MEYKKWSLIAFVAMVVVQLSVLGSMVFSKEKVIKTGNDYKFLTAPVDPNDPFRGKYIALNFSNNECLTTDIDQWYIGQDVYALLSTDDRGYAQVVSISEVPFGQTEDYISANIRSFREAEPSAVFLSFPFSRFYMEETKAPQAEKMYRQALRDSLHEAYALVTVMDGKSVLKDVILGSESITELVDQ